jgi:Fe-Mn family superoxide dismutase
MNKFEEKQFNIGELEGMSKESVEEHLKLYSGYVKHANIIREKVETLSEDIEKNAFVINELQRRFSFEFNGMRNHEIYFSSLEGESANLSEESPLYKKITEQWGSFDAWLEIFKQIAKTRGVGWAVLYFDPASKELMNGWIDQQHLGQLNAAIPVLMIDMWEHSFVSDYQPSGKGQYIDDFFKNLNWSVIENNYNQAVK